MRNRTLRLERFLLGIQNKNENLRIIKKIRLYKKGFCSIKIPYRVR